MVFRSRTGRLVLFGLVGALAVAAGCDRDEQVRSYRVPKELPQSLPASHAGHGHASQQRMLAAVLPGPGGAKTWFFKLVGPVEIVATQKDNFDALLRSVRFGPGGDPQWTLPAGWQQLPGNEQRFATLVVAAEPTSPLEVSVTAFGGDAGGFVPNVNRWRKQLTLPDATPEDIQKVTTTVETGAGPAKVVDLLGPDPHAAAAAAGPNQDTTPAPGADDLAAAPLPAPVAEPGTGSFTLAEWKLPPGWSEDPAERPMRVKTFRVDSKSGPLEMAVSKFPRAGPGIGGYLNNINRWRGQVGLPPTEQPVEHPAEKVDAGGREWAVYDIKGPNGRLRVPVAVFGGDYWFFKLQGPDAAIEEQKQATIDFLASLKFTPGQ